MPQSSKRKSKVQNASQNITETYSRDTSKTRYNSLYSLSRRRNLLIRRILLLSIFIGLILLVIWKKYTLAAQITMTLLVGLYVQMFQSTRTETSETQNQKKHRYSNSYLPLIELIKSKISEKIKILILGDSGSGSGKTSFIAGMYAAIQDSSAFSFKATDPDQSVLLTALWSNIVYNSGDERWPPCTDQPGTYNFELCYAHKPLIEFEWLDCPSGRMLALSSQPDAKIFRDYATQSNSFFFCISSKYLRYPVTKANLQEIAIESKANLMSNSLKYLSTNRRPDEKKSFPIVILVTMYDYCYHRDKRELIEDIKKIFPTLFAPHSGWLVMICPITLGKELAQDRDNGKIEPRNLNIPVAFLLYWILTEQTRSQQKKVIEIEDKLDDIESSNLFHQLISGSKIRKLNEDLEKEDTQLQETIEMTNLLTREQDLSSTDIYLSGKKIQIDLS